MPVTRSKTWEGGGEAAGVQIETFLVMKMYNIYFIGKFQNIVRQPKMWVCTPTKNKTNGFQGQKRGLGLTKLPFIFLPPLPPSPIESLLRGVKRDPLERQVKPSTGHFYLRVAPVAVSGFIRSIIKWVCVIFSMFASIT